MENASLNLTQSTIMDQICQISEIKWQKYVFIMQKNSFLGVILYFFGLFLMIY